MHRHASSNVPMLCDVPSSPPHRKLSVPCMTTPLPTQTRCPSRTATSSSTFSPSTRAGCTAPCSAPARQACCQPTTWKPSKLQIRSPPPPALRSECTYPLGEMHQRKKNNRKKETETCNILGFLENKCFMFSC